MKILINKDFQTLNELGIHVYRKYPNVRFLFEIDFSKDDYVYIKELFQKDYQFQDTYFQDDFFIRYFRNNKNNRIPFLILLVGFIRYEYLNEENQANFFDNFLKNIIENKKADSKDFRKSIIDYFFRWRGNRIHEEQGLYIYEIQTSRVSLKLEDAGKHKYLNSFIFHSGGISEQDLKEYLKIIRYLSEKEFDYEISSTQLFELYQNKDFTAYSNKLSNLFGLLNSDSEISEYVRIFIIQSIATISNCKLEFDFKLPLYIKNYLLFIGKYGNGLEKINTNETDFLYENRTILFNPCFREIYKDIEHISFNIDGHIYSVKKKHDIYIESDFSEFKVPINNIDKIFTMEFLIDNNLYRRFEINLFKNDFILLDSGYDIKHISNREIYIPKRDEEETYYIISNQYLDLDLSNMDIDNYFIYKFPLNVDNSTIDIGSSKIYQLYFSPRISSDIEYKDSEDFLYTSKLPKFKLSPKDKDRFLAIDLHTDSELNFDDFYKYNEPIGKFEIHINNKVFKIIYISGFEILKWFNWYDANKTIKIKVSSKKIKVNSDEVEEENDSCIHTFKLKEHDNVLVFNQLDGNHIHLKVLKPIIEMSFLDKRKNETRIKSKNIKFERLSFYRQLKIKLLNYPSSIKFDKIKIGNKEDNITKNLNNYFISIKKIKELSQENEDNYVSVVLKNDYYFLPITNIIFDNLIVKNNKQGKEILISDIDFLMYNMDNIKYYINNKPYFINGIETIEIMGFVTEMLVLNEIRQTQKDTIIKKSFNTIRKDGLYVQLKDIDYE